MNLVAVTLALLSIVIVLGALTILERYLRTVFAPHDSRVTPLYQGGESIETRERGYEMDSINLTMYFMILHVVGFFGASLYILDLSGINPFNWVSLGFGAIIFYTVLFISRISR